MLATQTTSRKIKFMNGFFADWEISMGFCAILGMVLTNVRQKWMV